MTYTDGGGLPALRRRTSHPLRFTSVTPSGPGRRGSQGSLRHPHALARALADHGVIADMRAPTCCASASTRSAPPTGNCSPRRGAFGASPPGPRTTRRRGGRDR
ncbi:kynureninase/PvdN C-terminal domain-containing protein [Streptomyces dangxiongensis]|uniref:kynureninase/PvdN C-terminal domain-containing protein n=1 Tax=Streptomyces dangxiongensis TaxID=1442032 RepID=UPI00374459D1